MVLTELYMYYRAGRGKTEYAEELWIFLLPKINLDAP
jgi:hypothetical protein